MNGKKLLEHMDLVDQKFIEEATYPKKKKMHISKVTAIAACLVLVLSLGGIAYGTGVIDAMRSYFSPESESSQSLLHEGTITVKDGDREMRVENEIGDENRFWFSVSFLGMGESLHTEDLHDTVWITKDNKRITVFNRESGAYTEGFERGEGSQADALSIYEDADATFLIGSQVPDGYAMEDMKALELTCRGMTIEAPVVNIVKTYALSPENEKGIISDFRASAIGFSYIGGYGDIIHINPILSDGTVLSEDDPSWHGFETSSSTEEARTLGNWGGDDAIAIGVLDLDKYLGFEINGVKYYFAK